eukprot:GHRQ01008474.1.p1 GENE.GHRQ01008474.1~~GHRQ01008474.1.p1  ORF type:complete len:317 (+),score=92.04 GHRQ01008474.1:111-1061(+)
MAGSTAGSRHAETSAHLYDAVGQVWLEMFGEHVHVGYYPEGWPESNHKKSWQTAQLDHVDAVLKFAGVSKAERLLDLGCGYGGTAVHIAEQLECKAIGVNISPFQVQAANSLARRMRFGEKEVYFVVGDALQPDLPDGCADLVVSLESASYMPCKEKFVAQLARLCAAGGTVILVDFCRAPGPISTSLAKRLASMDSIFATPGNWHSAEQYKQLMGQCGLTVIRDGDWTRNVCGFWNVCLGSLLFRTSRPNMTFAQKYKEVHDRAVRTGWLLLTGGPAVLKMAVGYLLGQQKAVVQGGLDSGVLEYHVIVAKKPGK